MYIYIKCSHANGIYSTNSPGSQGWYELSPNLHFGGVDIFTGMIRVESLYIYMCVYIYLFACIYIYFRCSRNRTIRTLRPLTQIVYICGWHRQKREHTKNTLSVIRTRDMRFFIYRKKLLTKFLC